jgi:hypothetical protein
MPHDLLPTSPHVILLRHAVLSRLAVLRQLQGRLHQCWMILESPALSININFGNQGKLGS